LHRPGPIPATDGIPVVISPTRMWITEVLIKTGFPVTLQTPSIQKWNDTSPIFLDAFFLSFITLSVPLFSATLPVMK